MCPARTIRAFACLQRFALYSPTLSHAQLVWANMHSEHKLAAQAAAPAPGRLLALDLGLRRVGVAVSDELRLTVRPLPALGRTNWKKLVREISELRTRFDAQGVVVGLPLRLDGTEGEAATSARQVARNLALSLCVDIHLQDERLTSREAEANLRAEKFTPDELKELVDSAAAALILRDFLVQVEN